MEITKGKLHKALKVVVYGPEGIGKSTFASMFPEVMFIDTEGSTASMDVARLPKPSSWSMLLDIIRYVCSNPGICKTLVIDTIDWAEQLCVDSVCANHNKKGIEDFGYGNGYVYCKEEFGRFLNLLNDVIDRNINIVLNAHAQIRKFEQPDELGAYDRYELKLGKKTSSQTAPLVKEWADIVLFANYKTMSIAVDKDGKKHKAQGGRRVMYTAHHPCWDAKNRHGLDEELPFEFASIAHLFKEPTPKVEEKKVLNMDDNVGSGPMDYTVPQESESQYEGLPTALIDLMKIDKITTDNIRMAVSKNGITTAEMPVNRYPADFINGELIPNWSKWVKFIRDQILPF